MFDRLYVQLHKHILYYLLQNVNIPIYYGGELCDLLGFYIELSVSHLVYLLENILHQDQADIIDKMVILYIIRLCSCPYKCTSVNDHSAQKDNLMVKYPQQLNRQSPLALYYQLKRILIAQIDAGEYKEGDRLPLENELTQEYQVSRHVVRQALKALVDEGRIIAYQGSGYFVNRKRIRKALPKLSSHTKSMSVLEQRTSTLVSRQEISTPPDYISERLLPGGEENAIVIERVSYLEDEPVCIIIAYYPLRFQEVLLDVDLENQSIYARLEECCSITPHRAETVVSVTFADEHQSAMLRIREGMPLLKIGSFTWSNNGELFEYSLGYYRVDRFELELEQS